MYSKKPGEGETIHFISHVWLGDKHPDSHSADAGWSIYPLGYFFGYLKGAVGDSILNLVYYPADLGLLVSRMQRGRQRGLHCHCQGHLHPLHGGVLRPWP